MDALFVGPFDLGLAIGAAQPGVLGSVGAIGTGGSDGGSPESEHEHEQGQGHGNENGYRHGRSQHNTVPLSPDPLLAEAVAHVLNAAHSAGKRAAIFCGNGDAARDMAHAGFDLVVPGHDALHITRGAAADLDAVRRAFPIR